jgi:hypothetical protein
VLWDDSVALIQMVPIAQRNHSLAIMDTQLFFRRAIETLVIAMQ